jgi:PD-(D/E)XK nuclease superfamily protein
MRGLRPSTGSTFTRFGISRVTEANEGNENPSSKAQLFSYMKLLDIPLGLLINFHEPILKNGILRMILLGANQREGGDDNKVSLWDPYPATLLSSLTSVEVLCGGFHVTGKWRKTKG